MYCIYESKVSLSLSLSWCEGLDYFPSYVMLHLISGNTASLYRFPNLLQIAQTQQKGSQLLSSSNLKLLCFEILQYLESA